MSSLLIYGTLLLCQTGLFLFAFHLPIIGGSRNTCKNKIFFWQFKVFLIFLLALSCILYYTNICRKQTVYTPYLLFILPSKERWLPHRSFTFLFFHDFCPKYLTGLCRKSADNRNRNIYNARRLNWKYPLPRPAARIYIHILCFLDHILSYVFRKSG